MLSVYKKDTIFGRNINSNLPLYYDNIVLEGNITQETREGTNYFDASKIENENIIVTDKGKTITMPVYTSGNGYTSTNKKLSELAPNLRVGDVVYLKFDKSPNSYNNFIYIGSTWNNNSQRTITQNDLNSTVILYGNRYQDGQTEQVVITNFRIVINQNAEWEQYGVMPSPDYPSELVSVGYENLFTGLTIGIGLDSTNGSQKQNYKSATSDYIAVDLSNSYYLSGLVDSVSSFVAAYNSSKVFLGRTSGTTRSEIQLRKNSFGAGTPQGTGDIAYIRITQYSSTSFPTELINNAKIQLDKGAQPHSYIPYGKYGLEVKTTGKNLFSGFREISTNGTYENGVLEVSASGGGNCYSNYFIPTGNRTYYFNYISSYATARYYVAEYDSNYTQLRSSSKTAPQSFTIGNDAKYFAIIWNFASSTTFPLTISNMQLEKGNRATVYEPYIGHTNLIILNEPLRGIGDVNDTLYINNGMLYVERKIGSVVLNGSESNWHVSNDGTKYAYWIYGNKISNYKEERLIKYSNYFSYENVNWRDANSPCIAENTNAGNLLLFRIDNITSLDDWKTWLSTHNTEVNYILAESIIESYELDVQPMIFESLGYGILSDVVSDSLITEELNGSYVLEFEYMKNGKFSEFLIEENIIKAHGEPFSIYSVKKDTDGKIKILAKHWVLNEWTKDFILDSAPTDLVAQSALNWIQERSINHSNILITGDCDSMASARYVRKNMLDAIFKEDNSILNRFGGELSYNKNNVTINKHRGNSAGITIRQGKNITGAEYYLDFSTVTTRLVPVGKDGLMLNNIYVDSPIIDKYATPIIRKVDVDTDSTEELENYCNQLFESGIDKPTVSIKIDFIELSKTTEYKNYSSLETAHLGDTVIAYIPSLNLNISTRVVKVVYNDNLQRITSLELGSITQNIATSNVNFERKMQKQIDLLVASDSSVLEEAKQNATDLINHPFGGHIYIDENSGNMYIMDTTDINTAQNIWRWGLGGLGFSSTGINGPYGVAMTQDGKIVADYITAGVLSANVIGSMNLNLTSKNFSISSTNFTLSPDGTMNAKNGKFSGSVEIEGDKPNYSNDDDADLYVHYHELEEDVEGFDGTGEIETTNESKVFSNGVFLQSKYNNSVPGSTSNTNGLDRVSQLNIDSYSSYEPVVIRRFFRDSNDNISGESNSIMKYGGFEAHDVATGDFSVIGSEMVLTDPNNKSITISPNSIPTSVLSNWYSTTAATLTGAKNHKLLVILARPGSSSAIMSLIIPTDCLTTSNQEFQVADESNYVSFNIKYSGSNILIAGASRSNYGSIISAWTML